MKKLCRHSFTKGHLSYGQVVPRSFTSKPLSIDKLESQCDIRTRWPDGSVAHAVLSAIVPADDAYEILAEDDELPPPEPEPQMEVIIARDGKPYSVALSPIYFEPTGSADWLSGPLVEEHRYDFLPQNAAGEMPAKGLVVLFDIRMFRDGAKRISVAVENCEDRADAELLVTYDVVIRYKGETIFEQTGAGHYWGQRWRHVFGADGYVESRVTYDLEPYFEAGAIPRIQKEMEYTAIRATPIETWDILKRGPMPEDGQAHGGRSDMAIVPQWIAEWIVVQGEMQWDYMLHAADLSGSLPIHMREPDSMALPNLDERPTLWGFSGKEKNRPDATKVPFPDTPRWSIPSSAGSSYARKIDTAHSPSLALVPYLLSGDRYLCDEVSFWANYHLVTAYSQDVRETQVFDGDKEIRGRAYALRNLTDAAAWLPDSDPMKEHYVRKVNETLSKWNQISQNTPTPLGHIWHETDLADRSRIVAKEFQYGALLWAIDHANQLGFTGADHLFDRVAKFIIGCANDPAWLRGDDKRSALYQVWVGKKDPITKEPVYFQTWEDSERENAIGGYFRNDFLATTGDYSGSIWGGLVVANRRGVEGAKEAMERMKQFTVNSNPGWLVQPNESLVA